MSGEQQAASPMRDHRGTVICIGDEVMVLYIDRDRGAEMWMDRGEVVGFGRTRVKVQFSARTEPQSVGPECLRVVG
ncbi:MAG TPA: hypothetical protein VK088_06490 [Acidimicrobiia bacterium]|nr:hypothetical protein [Acidimicrobiia bacterium]